MAKKKSKKNIPTKSKKKQQQKNNEQVFWVAISMALATVLFTFFCYFPAENIGFIGDFIKSSFLLGFFSGTMYFLPPILLGLTIYIFKTKDLTRFIKKAVFSAIVFVLLGVLVQLFSSPDIYFSELYEHGTNARGGGLIGGILGLFFLKTLGRWPSVVIVLFAIFFLISLIFKISYSSIITSIFTGLKSEMEEIEDVDISDKVENTVKKIKERNQKKRPLSASDLDFEIDTPEKEEKSEPSISEDDLQKRINVLQKMNTNTCQIKTTEAIGTIMGLSKKVRI